MTVAKETIIEEGYKLAPDENIPVVTATLVEDPEQIPQSTIYKLLPPDNLHVLFHPNTGQEQQRLSRIPVQMITCPKCNKSNTLTKIRTFPSCVTWTCVGATFFLFWPLCWLPLVIDSTKQTDHFCTNCNEKIGEVRPFVDCCSG